MCRDKIQEIIRKIGVDKIAHFFGSAFLALALGRFIHPAIAALVTLTLGLVKEVLDAKFDKRDLLADALGVILGIAIALM